MRACLVIGGAARVWNDIEAALDLGEFHGAVACNDAGATWPGHLDAFVTLHAEKAGLWMERRRRAGLPMPDRIIGHDTVKTSTIRIPDCLTDFLPYRFPGQVDSGSSGLFALKVALIDLGFDKAVLCGVPMENWGAHFFDPTVWNGAESHQRGWRQAMPVIRDRTRSMSGWTMKQLGSPTPEWLAA